jgi:hypothetical protein
MQSIPPQRELHNILFDEEKCIEFLKSIGAVYDERACPTCATTMKYKSNRRTFRCPKKYCRKEVSIFQGSFFSKIKMPICDVMNIAYLWLSGATHKTLCSAGAHAKKTVTAFTGYFRQMLATNVEDEQITIGGQNIIVEIDESKVAKRKYNRGHHVAGSWVVGGVERTSEKKLFVITVPDRSGVSLKDIIYLYVEKGSIIITDCWKGYDWLCNDRNFIHMKVNHSKTFKDPQTGACTNSIEGTWAALKATIPKRNRTKGDIDSYVLNYIWRRQHKNNLWQSFIKCLADTDFQDE